MARRKNMIRFMNVVGGETMEEIIMQLHGAAVVAERRSSRTHPEARAPQLLTAQPKDSANHCARSWARQEAATLPTRLAAAW